MYLQLHITYYGFSPTCFRHSCDSRWLKLLIKLLLFHQVGCLYYYTHSIFKYPLNNSNDDLLNHQAAEQQLSAADTSTNLNAKLLCKSPVWILLFISWYCWLIFVIFCVSDCDLQLPVCVSFCSNPYWNVHRYVVDVLSHMLPIMFIIWSGGLIRVCCHAYSIVTFVWEDFVCAVVGDVSITAAHKNRK